MGLIDALLSTIIFLQDIVYKSMITLRAFYIVLKRKSFAWQSMAAVEKENSGIGLIKYAFRLKCSFTFGLLLFYMSYNVLFPGTILSTILLILILSFVLGPLFSWFTAQKQSGILYIKAAFPIIFIAITSFYLVKYTPITKYALELLLNSSNKALVVGARPQEKDEARDLKLDDDEFLDLISRKAFDFFREKQSPVTGLFADTIGGDASIAVTGFGLTALCIGAEKGWITKDEARKRVLRCINVLLKNPNTSNDIATKRKDGFFYHFLDMKTAERAGKAEVSTVDTALLICGAITAGEYFGGEVKMAAEMLYREVEWNKFLDKAANLFFMGWTPEKGYLKWRWNVYTDEVMLLSLLAIGSPSHPVSPDVFYAWLRKKGSYKNGEPFICSWQGALFTYQYAHAWFDFRNKLDKEGIDWWENSVNAVRASIEFCSDNADRYKGFGRDSWGITSYDTPEGYNMSCGFPPCLSGKPVYDGTVSPSGPAGSIVFTPIESLNALRNFYNNQDKLWGRYGFKDSYNLDKNWYSQQYFGLGEGITLLMIENFRTNFVWKIFMKNEHIQRAMEKAGFKAKFHNPPPAQSAITSDCERVHP